MIRHQYQNANGNIGVRGPDGVYFDTIENFTADYGHPPPPLPEGVLDQIYEPGRLHAHGDGDGNTIGGGDVVFAEGDAIIASLKNLLSAQSKRVAAAYEAAGVEFRTQQKIAQQEWHKEQIRLLNSPEV